MDGVCLITLHYSTCFALLLLFKPDFLNRLTPLGRWIMVITHSPTGFELFSPCQQWCNPNRRCLMEASWSWTVVEMFCKTSCWAKQYFHPSKSQKEVRQVMIWCGNCAGFIGEYSLVCWFGSPGSQPSSFPLEPLMKYSTLYFELPGRGAMMQILTCGLYVLPIWSLSAFRPSKPMCFVWSSSQYNLGPRDLNLVMPSNMSAMKHGFLL